MMQRNRDYIYRVDEEIVPHVDNIRLKRFRYLGVLEIPHRRVSVVIFCHVGYKQTCKVVDPDGWLDAGNSFES